MAAADDFGRGRGHLLQRRDGFLSLAFLVDAQAGVDQHHGQDDPRVGQAFMGIERGNRTDQRGGDQHDGHGVLQLAEELFQQAFLFAFFQLVMPVPGQPRGGFLLGQACHGRTQFRQDGFFILKIWFQSNYPPCRKPTVSGTHHTTFRAVLSDGFFLVFLLRRRAGNGYNGASFGNGNGNAEGTA